MTTLVTVNTVEETGTNPVAINFMASCIEKAEKHLCTLRRDLFESGLGAPVGNDNEFIIDDKRYKYRWLGDQFQVKFEGIWENAYSIDFDFD